MCGSSKVWLFFGEPKPNQIFFYTKTEIRFGFIAKTELNLVSVWIILFGTTNIAIEFYKMMV